MYAVKVARRGIPVFHALNHLNLMNYGPAFRRAELSSIPIDTRKLRVSAGQCAVLQMMD